MVETGLGIILAHLVGDYVIQSHWMAVEKTKRWFPAVAHALTYTLPYLLVTHSPLALFLIGGTHAVIDRYRLARYAAWFSNQLAPRAHRYPLTTDTGYPADVPLWLAVWLLFIIDNTIHLLINTAAVTYA